MPIALFPFKCNFEMIISVLSKSLTMPLIVFDAEMAEQLGYKDDPISILRKLGYPSAELVAGHPAMGATLLKVDSIIRPLPAFLSEEEEHSPENKSKVTLVKKDAPPVNKTVSKG